MTLDEALNELGIDHEADAEGARRAYLRLLKKRKPEVDRDGFMRLRQAYELAKPYFDQIEMFRAIENAARAEPSNGDGAPEVLRIETPAGIVWVQRSRPAETNSDEPAAQDKPVAVVDKPPVVEEAAPIENVVAAFEPPIEQALPVDDAPVEAEADSSTKPPAEPDVEPAANVSDAELSEPSIDELIAAGKFKKAARRMRDQYHSAVQQGTVGVAVSAPHQAVLLLLQLHEKNRVDEARALEKEFADWLSSTGASVRIMAGPLGVMWLIARELSAVSKNFPPVLREGISKAVIAGKLDEVKRRAGWFQTSDPGKARSAALDLHAHAPTLATLIGDTLSPPEPRTAPASSGSRGGSWGIGIVLVLLMNVIRVFVSSPSSTPTSYSGQSDPAAYFRPSPSPSPHSYAQSAQSKPIATLDGGFAVDESVKMDKATRDKLVMVAQKIEAAAEKATKLEELWIIQRTRYVRSALEMGSCDRASAEMFGFYTDAHNLTSPLRETLLPNVTILDKMFHAACPTENAAKAPKDGGPKKP